MKNSIKHSAKILVALALALGVSIFISQIFFINNSPQFRQGAPQYLAQSIQSFILNILPSRNNIARDPRFTELEKVAFTSISSGVSAREKNGVAEVVYDQNKVKWIKYTYKTRDGQVFTLDVAEGQNPPPQQIAEMLR